MPCRVDYMNNFLSVQYYLLLPTHTGSPSTGSFTGQWYQESVTSRRTINKLLLTSVSRCPSQIVPELKERTFRIGVAITLL